MITIVIPSIYERSESLKDCLISINKSTYLPDVILIIGDSNQHYNSIKQWISDFPHLKIIFKKSKRNVAHRRNIGLTYAKGDIVIYFSDDVIVDKNWIKNCAIFFKHNPNIIVLRGKIENYYKNNRLCEYSKKYIDLWLFDGKNRNINSIFETKSAPTIAVAMNLRKIKKHKLLFDERLVSAEDTDFVLRASRFGKIYYNPRLVVWHKFHRLFKDFIAERIWWGKGFYHFLLKINNTQQLSFKIILESLISNLKFYWHQRNNNGIGFLLFLPIHEFFWQIGILYEHLMVHNEVKKI